MDGRAFLIVIVLFLTTPVHLCHRAASGAADALEITCGEPVVVGDPLPGWAS